MINYDQFSDKFEKSFEILEKYLEHLKFFKFEILSKEINVSIEFAKKFLELKNYKTQLMKFLKDLKTYGPATYLWFEKEYPDISRIFTSLKLKSQIQKFKNIIDIKDEIILFYRTAKSKYPILFQEEINDSMNKFFNKQEKPSQLIIDENPILWNIGNLIISSMDQFNNLFQKMQIDAERISKKVKLNVKSKKTTKFLFKFYKKNIKNGTVEKLKNLDNSHSKIYKPIEESKKNKKFAARRILNSISAYDSYQVQLVKFYYRLNWILNNGNRSFHSHEVNSQPNYKKLIDFLEKELSLNYPNLSNYFLFFFRELTKFRHIKAHELPKITLSKNKIYASLILKGVEKPLRIHLKKMRNLISSYIDFSEIHIKFLDLI